MDNVILHLGLAKTGTSWLQKELFPKLPVTFYHCNHYDILNKKIKGITVFSFEGFSGTPYDNDRYIILYRLYKLFPNARIIVSFRDKKDYVRSLYSQYIKGGGIIDEQSFSSWIESNKVFYDWNLYRKQIMKYWGKNNCLFPVFDGGKDFNILDYADMICDFIGVKYNHNINLDKKNVSLNDIQIKTWRKTNKLFKSKWNLKGLFPRFCNPCFIYNNLFNLHKSLIDLWDNEEDEIWDEY